LLASVFATIKCTVTEICPAHLTTGVYITAFLAGGAQAHVTVYGMTVASLAPLVEYSL
jgi:hypothetical protein